MSAFAKAVPSQTTFVSLDGRERARGVRIDVDADDLAALATGAAPMIPRGSGISFVAASFGDGVRSLVAPASTSPIELDLDGGRVRVDAATTLAELYRDTIPHGLYLPVLPGHPQISVGGSIACNVHGKNPARHGTFLDYVDSLELFHPRHGTLALSRAREPGLFDLTCGGLGLTGVILSATLRLQALPSSWVEVVRRPTRSFAETAETITAASDELDFVHSWNDVSAFDDRLGRGYLGAARFVVRAEPCRRDPLVYPRHDPSAETRRRRWLRPATIPWIARLHRFVELRRPTTTMELYDFVFPGMGFRSSRYYAWYGAAGMIAHAVLIPRQILAPYLQEFETTLRRHRLPLLIASMKNFRGAPRWLRFDGDGVVLHLHIPSDERGTRLAADLEGLATEARAPRAVYLDSRLTREQAEAGYPEIDDFRSRLRDFDPERRFQSQLSRRLGL